MEKTPNIAAVLVCGFIFSLSVGRASGQMSVTTCELQENATNYLNVVVEVRSMIIEGFIHGAFIYDERCKFLFAFGDDYQTFGTQFPATKNAQWKKMRQILSKTECANNARAVKATFRGTVTRIPATGTIPPDEMGLELVIQSVSGVEPISLKCTPQTVSR